ncbi:MAG: hypothetical protein IPK13_20705 [Deltaproteobacteria bacterium]|nr:hypothetical protein [Deltaproteobacteria bacterium]
MTNDSDEHLEPASTPVGQRDEEAEWGEPPLGEDIAHFLKERWSRDPGDRVSVEVDEAARALSCRLVKARARFDIRLTYRRGAGSRDPWMLMADTLDALYGLLEESGYAHRELPQGPDVEHLQAFFSVSVEKVAPDLEALANQWLKMSTDPKTA